MLGMQMYVARHDNILAAQGEGAQKRWESVCAVIDSSKSLHMQLQERAEACREGKGIAVAPTEITGAQVRTRYIPSAKPLVLPEEAEETANRFLTSRFYGEQPLCTILYFLFNNLFTEHIFSVDRSQCLSTACSQEPSFLLTGVNGCQQAVHKSHGFCEQPVDNH